MESFCAYLDAAREKLDALTFQSKIQGVLDYTSKDFNLLLKTFRDLIAAAEQMKPPRLLSTAGTFNVGHTVRLKGGGPTMTIVDIFEGDETDDPRWECVCFCGTSFVRERFPEEAIETVAQPLRVGF